MYMLRHLDNNENALKGMCMDKAALITPFNKIWF